MIGRLQACTYGYATHEGMIRHLGVSNARPEHLAQAGQIAPVVCVQNSYGLGHRPGQDQFLRACGEQGVAFVPFFAIAGAGREAGPSGAEPGEVLAAAGSTRPPRRRSAWPGPCTADRTCWASGHIRPRSPRRQHRRRSIAAHARRPDPA